MKYLIALLFPVTALAGPSVETCKTWGEMAEYYATVRYQDTSMEEVLESIRPNDRRDIAQHIISDVFQLPPVMTKEGKDRMILNYRNKIFGECYQHVLTATDR